MRNSLKQQLGGQKWIVLQLSKGMEVKIGKGLNDFDWIKFIRQEGAKYKGKVNSVYYLIQQIVMFNISRLTQYFNTLHTYAPKPNILYPPVLQNQQPESLFAQNNDSNEGNANEKERGRVVEKRAEIKKKERKDRDEDDNDNENGGFLEPILEDLQGFLQGKRRLAPAILSI